MVRVRRLQWAAWLWFKIIVWVGDRSNLTEFTKGRGLGKQYKSEIQQEVLNKANERGNGFILQDKITILNKVALLFYMNIHDRALSSQLSTKLLYFYMNIHNCFVFIILNKVALTFYMNIRNSFIFTIRIPKSNSKLTQEKCDTEI